MAKKERKFRLYNRIGFLAISLVLVLVTVLGMGDSFLPTSLALEQEARCEMEEHVHTEECYIDSVLLCDKKAHTHSENCYLVLLKDNDINTLLTTVDADENDSLEGAIQSTLALAAEEESTSDGESDPAPSPTATATPTPTATATPEPTATPTPTPAISAQLLAASNTSTATTLALNENLYGVSTLALEDEVATAAEVAEIVPEDGYAGLYVWIADENKWECIGTLRMNFSFGEWAYSVSLSDINSTYRQVLGYAPGTGAGTYSYSTSVPSNNGSHTQITGSDAYMGRSYGPRYIYLEPGGTPTNFYRVTYDYLNQDDVAIYVRVNNTTTLPTLGTGYAWEHQGTMARIDGGTSVTVASSVTYKQVSKSVTVTWVYPDKTETDTQTPQGSSVSFDVPTLSGYASEYIWVDAANSKVTGSTVTLTADATYRAIPRYYTVTYLSSSGAELYKDTVEYGASAALRTAPDSHFWVDADGTVYLDTIEKVTENLTLTATTNVSAVFNYSDGTTQSVGPYLPGTKITLPTLTGTRVWEDEAGNTYAGGTEVTLTQNKIFTERVSLTLSYDVNFPTSGYDFYYDVTAPAASPTVYGATTSTASFPVAENSTATLRTVSTTIVRLETAHGKDFTYPVAFKGWESETGELISAHSRLSWNELLGYDKDGDGIVEMTGVWVDGRAEMANFFILHNAQVDQTTGNANDYTTSIYSTVVGNSNTTKNPLYTADDDATALKNDADIRKMYGERSDGMWFYSFPTDEEIFEALKDHVDDLTVNGEKVSADKLNSNEYAIRWYQVAYDGGDGWHIDGKLTRKVGAIEVRKTFSGNETLIEAAKENFSITATNAGGTKSHTLNASNAIDDGDGNPNTWYWRITGVEYNEAWTLTESANTDNSIHYAEWAVVDASVNSQTGNGTGASVTVTGVTYASDLANPEWLQVDFNNIYYHKDSLMIKKADGVTGEALSGAQFQLFQNGTRMTFDYNSSTGMYVYNPAGSGAYNTLTCDGYVNIAATGFTFDVHDISVVEIKAPTNYNPVGEIRVGYIDSTTIGITNGVDYATYHDGLLVVYNSTNTLNVTARKDWECEAAEWRDITVQLFANDSANLASTLTGSSSTVVTLTAANDYSYTWENLPIYAYGTKVEWSIKETQIGDEACKADYTFANWAVSYDAPAYDSDGNVTLMVHNTPSRPLLYLTKTNADGSYQLSGATFTLVQVNSSGVMVDGFVPRTGTTNEQGVLIFDNLLYGARYRISEDTPPSGYRPISEPIYVTIAEGGLVTVESHTHAKADAVAYNMVVTNDAYPPLPATGAGVVPGFYVRTGALLMAAALFLLAYEQRRRREAERPDA